jgi:hypothetical protein
MGAGSHLSYVIKVQPRGRGFPSSNWIIYRALAQLATGYSLQSKRMDASSS